VCFPEIREPKPADFYQYRLPDLVVDAPMSVPGFAPTRPAARPNPAVSTGKRLARIPP
jgi:hypothetical protein